MPANRQSKFIAVLLVAMALSAFGACKKDAADGGADSPTAKGQFAYLPKDANWVIGVYPQQLAASTMFKEYVEPDLAKSPEYQELKTACGFDPATAVSALVFAGNTANDEAVGTVKGVTKAQFVKCVPALAAEGDETPTVTEDGDFVKVEAGGQATWVGWTDEKTLVGRSGARDKASVEAIVKTTEGLDKNEDMMKLIGQLDSKATVWFAVRNEKPGQPLEGVPVPVNAIYGSVNFAQGLALNFTLQQGTPEEAQSTVATMTPQLAAVKQMMPFLSKLEMKPEGSDVQVTLNLNTDELKELAPLLQQQLGGMLPGGMMGGPAGMDHPGHGGDMADGEEAPAGEVPEGEAPAGEAPEGEEAVEAPAGE